MRKKICTKHSIDKEELENTVLKLVNTQIDFLLDVDSKINEIVENNEVNYDIEILNSKLLELDDCIKKYNKLKDSVTKDFEKGYIAKDEFLEYKKDYNNTLNKFENERKAIKEQLDKVNMKSEKNKEWIAKFIVNKNLKKLTKKVVDELIDSILVYENGDLKIIFKYENEFLEAIRFIKQHNCDIIEKVS